jgi:hypothetical protein
VRNWHLLLDLIGYDVVAMIIRLLVTGADGPHRLVGDDDVEHLFGRHVHQILHNLHGAHLMVQTTEDPNTHPSIHQSIYQSTERSYQPTIKSQKRGQEKNE